MKKHSFFALVAATAASISLAQAGETTNTLQEIWDREVPPCNKFQHLVGLQSPSPSLEKEKSIQAVEISYHRELQSPEQPEGFWRGLETESALQADREVRAEFLLPASKLRWSSLELGGYGVHERIASSGRNSFLAGLRRGGRQTFADTLPTDQWANWLSNLFRHSVGDPEKGDVHFGSVSPGEGDVRWFRSNEDGPMEYAVEPWNLDMFFKANIGHSGRNSRLGEQPLIVLIARYEGDPTSAGKLKAGIAVPLPFSWRIASSCSVDVLDITSFESRDITWAVRLERIISIGGRLRSLVYGGIQSRSTIDHSGHGMLACGILYPW